MALVADVTPECIELSALNAIVLEQTLFKFVSVLGSLAEPSEDGVFLEALGAVKAADTHAFSQERQRLKDVFFLGAFAMEDRAVVLVEGLAAGFAAKTLLALAGFAELDEVALVGFAEVGAVLIGAKVAYLGYVGSLPVKCC